MANYIIKNPRQITVQENDNSITTIFPAIEFPFADAEFTFEVFAKTSSLFKKTNANIVRGTQIIEGVTRNKLEIEIFPNDTRGHGGKDATWQLLMKKVEGKFIRIGKGKFVIIKMLGNNV